MNEDRDMKFEEFETGLARHGADLSLWPELERPAAARLLARSAEARDAQAAMAMLEDGFETARAAPETASEALLARVMADAADVAAGWAPPPQQPTVGPMGRLWAAAKARTPSFKALRPAFVCAASAACGLWLGQSALVAGAAQTLIVGEAAAAGTFALDNDEALDDIAFAFLPDEGRWR